MKSPLSIAVVGMSATFPDAPDLETFWRNIADKKDASRTVPPDRWILPRDKVYAHEIIPDKAWSKKACLIQEFTFDPHGFPFPATFLQELDPLFHLVLQTGRNALKPFSLPPSIARKTGVILAAIALPTDATSQFTRNTLGHAYQVQMQEAFSNAFGNALPVPPISDPFPPRLTHAQVFSNRVTGFPAALLAQAFNLGGGTYTLDAACASSLYAIKLSCDALRTGQCDLMVTGGVSRPDALFTQIGFTQLQALSPTGKCAPFDVSANGLVVGEGCGILVLKRLQDAIQDGDPIWGVIKGIGLSNDMGGNLIAPLEEGQYRAMQDAYAMSGWCPQDVDFIECHGAGTPLGDQVELSSLRSIFNAFGPSSGAPPTVIGSVKSNIGHLLTAAGAAGMIKALLAFHHKTLPPSANFHQAPQNSPIADRMFRVLKSEEPFRPRSTDTPMRAAVSAFGFGGINAHVVLEEWTSPQTSGGEIPRIEVRPKHNASRVAIIGMATLFGNQPDLTSFEKDVFAGKNRFRPRPPQRWFGVESIPDILDAFPVTHGVFMEDLSTYIGEFNIPPNELKDLLPQQLLMLKVAKNSFQDAGLSLKKPLMRMGAVIGMQFDFQTTHFHLRWQLERLIEEWRTYYTTSLAHDVLNHWLTTLTQTWWAPLTASRTIGALGSIIASRIAKQYRIGGPAFTVSGEETSGLKALDIAIHSLQQYETDLFFTGALDLTGDPRRVMLDHFLIPYDPNTNPAPPFDTLFKGTPPGEGALGLVLKRYADALKDGDRIYALVKGIGSASGPSHHLMLDPQRDHSDQVATYRRSLDQAVQNADADYPSIGFVETHGGGSPTDHALEAEALSSYFKDAANPVAISALSPVLGHTGAAHGLAGIAKTALSLFHELLPPLPGYSHSSHPTITAGGFHIPILPQYWVRNRIEGPRKALCASMTTDGNVMHVLLEAAPEAPGLTDDKKAVHRVSPLAGQNSWGLFVASGKTGEALSTALVQMTRFMQTLSHNASLPMEQAAIKWYQLHQPDTSDLYRVSIIAQTPRMLLERCAQAQKAIVSEKAVRIHSAEGFHFSPDPLGEKGEVAFVFPGSGNHYVGMGKSIGVRWPMVLRQMDAMTEELKSQLLPGIYTPQRHAYPKGWEHEAYQKITDHPHHMIFGQVVHGGMLSRLMQNFGIRPNAVIGHSLGESAGLFALNAWPEQGQMLARMRQTDLFTHQLAGPMLAARQVWGLDKDARFSFRVAAVNRDKKAVEKVLSQIARVYLMIINAPSECIIGGHGAGVQEAIDRLSCNAVYLDGIVTVHCEVLAPVKDAYRALHYFPTTPPKGVRFYSCAWGKAYELTPDNAANAILDQALKGFDFVKTVQKAYQDGIRIFIEMGPQNSTSKLISRILEDSPHLAVSACVRGEDDYLTVIKCLGALIGEHVAVDLNAFYQISNKGTPISIESFPAQDLSIKIGESLPPPVLPAINATTETAMPPQPHSLMDLIDDFNQQNAQVAALHNQFLDFSKEMESVYAQTFALSARAMDTCHNTFPVSDGADSEIRFGLPEQPISPSIAYDRAMCLEFARGSVAKVLGPDFAELDTYPVRVRLPDEPLMLVDRILLVEGQKRSLGPGRIVTEHDVLPDAWYLDGGCAPVCISIEAGQADLFLCVYLGIDHVVQGKRRYRLLDATTTFYRELPRPHEVIRYDIHIEKFIRQGATYLFFFHFDGYIGDTRLIRMRNGCAGFFTPKEVADSGGIILTEEDTGPATGRKSDDFAPLIPMSVERYSEQQIDALRNGNAMACFGELFEGIHLSPPHRLPGGRLKLIDRVTTIDPSGGRYGIGSIRAEADIEPDDWFLTCHFVDDQVMPGTLMYECCAHTLRIFLLRMGWITDNPKICYEPIPNQMSVLKCRGPVTPLTKRVTYEVEIKEIGYRPEPYVIADAHMFSDDLRIVHFKDMGIQISHTSKEEMTAFWMHRSKSPSPLTSRLYDRNHLLTFALGKPSEAFGAPYSVFDGPRFIARLPNPPYLFMHRLVKVPVPPFQLTPSNWIEAEYDLDPADWYFTAHRLDMMPISVLMEIGLQPCGWLAAYMGSALKSNQDLRFRNLGGTATLYRMIPSGPPRKLTVRSRLTRYSSIGDMIIEHFDLLITDQGRRVYEGQTFFGFFTLAALSDQKGLKMEDDGLKADDPPLEYRYTPENPYRFETLNPFHPADPTASKDARYPFFPGKALSMIDQIDGYAEKGGPHGLGYIRGSKRVDPDEWFFKAHFYEDPVCPGSLGIESLVQLLKFMAFDQFADLAQSHCLELVTGIAHTWTYRGQIVPENKRIDVEAYITHREDTPEPMLLATGYLKVDGLYIYKMENFGVVLKPSL